MTTEIEQTVVELAQQVTALRRVERERALLIAEIARLSGVISASLTPPSIFDDPPQSGY